MASAHRMTEMNRIDVSWLISLPIPVQFDVLNARPVWPEAQSATGLVGRGGLGLVVLQYAIVPGQQARHHQLPFSNRPSSTLASPAMGGPGVLGRNVT